MKNLFSKYGRLASVLPFTFGKVFFVTKSTESYVSEVRQWLVGDDGVERVYSTLEAAYAACTTNANDVIILDSNSSHVLADKITWSKNRIHVFGLEWLMGDKRMVQQGTKVQMALGTEDVAYLIKVTGTRNSFHGLKLMMNSTHANALSVLQLAGEGNLVEDCSVLFSAVDNLDQTNAFELVLGEDSGTIRRCSFGTDVLLTSAARSVVSIDAITGASSADGAKSNRIEDCEFIIMSSEANATLVKLADTAGAKFTNIFDRPKFVATLNATNSAVAITNAFASASGFVEGSFSLIDPKTMFVTNTCAGVTDNVEVVAPAASNNAHEAVTPA